jgi:hypothetical protein
VFGKDLTGCGKVNISINSLDIENCAQNMDRKGRIWFLRRGLVRVSKLGIREYSIKANLFNIYLLPFRKREFRNLLSHPSRYRLYVTFPDNSSGLHNSAHIRVSPRTFPS